jgi:hypothetical protein
MGNLTLYDYICPSTRKFTFLSQPVVEKNHSSPRSHSASFVQLETTTTNEAPSNMTLLALSV